MTRRSARTLPATLVALAVLAGAVAVAVSCVQRLLGRAPWLPFGELTAAAAGLFDLAEHPDPWPDSPQGRTRREIYALQKGLKVFRGVGRVKGEG